MNKLKVGDKVKILAGKDRGREGQIEKVLLSSQKVVIPGVNVYKKHVKGFQGQKGGIYDLPRALPWGKVGLICPKCKQVTKVGIKVGGEKRVRFCKQCSLEIDTK